MSENIVDVKNMTKQYGRQLALDDVSFGIKKGSIVGLIGPNGAGKSTIMKIMGGLVFPTSGSLKMFGESSEKGLNHSRSRTSFMIETPYAKADMSARENLEKQRRQKGIPDKGRIDEVLKIVKLEDTGKKEVKKFSLGMKQRLGISIRLHPEGRNQRDLCSMRTAEELSQECSEYYHIDTDNNELASSILTKECGINKLEVLEDGSMRIYEGFDDMRRISKALYEGGVIPIQLARNEVNLEDYYMKKVQADV